MSFRADTATQFKPVEPGQHPIQNDEIGGPLLQHRQRGQAVRRKYDDMSR